jgi:hypothetical protein
MLELIDMVKSVGRGIKIGVAVTIGLLPLVFARPVQSFDGKKITKAISRTTEGIESPFVEVVLPDGSPAAYFRAWGGWFSFDGSFNYSREVGGTMTNQEGRASLIFHGDGEWGYHVQGQVDGVDYEGFTGAIEGNSKRIVVEPVIPPLYAGPMEAIEQAVASGVTLDLYVGNELSGGMAWPFTVYSLSCNLNAFQDSDNVEWLSGAVRFSDSGLEVALRVYEEESSSDIVVDVPSECYGHMMRLVATDRGGVTLLDELVGVDSGGIIYNMQKRGRLVYY